MPIGKAYMILVDADKRWGKFHLRTNGVEELVKIIEGAYGSDNQEGFRP